MTTVGTARGIVKPQSLLTPSDAAILMRWSEDRIRRLIRTGKLRAVTLGACQYVTLEDLREATGRLGDVR